MSQPLMNLSAPVLTEMTPDIKSRSFVRPFVAQLNSSTSVTGPSAARSADERCRPDGDMTATKVDLSKILRCANYRDILKFFTTGFLFPEERRSIIVYRPELTDQWIQFYTDCPEDLPASHRRLSLNPAGIKGNLNEFVLLPVPIGMVMKCRLTRVHEKGSLIFYLRLEDENSKNVQILSAQRLNNNRSPDVLIFTNAKTMIDPNTAVGYLKRIKSRKPKFSLFSGSPVCPMPGAPVAVAAATKSEEAVTTKQNKIRKEELGAITFSQKPFHPAKLKILIPELINECQRYEQPVDTTEKCQSMLLEKFNKGFMRGVMELRETGYTWSWSRGSFVLQKSSLRGFTDSYVQSFGSSEKIFQIVPPNRDDYLVLETQKVEKDSFMLDFQFPLCPLQAFGIYLTMFL